MDQAETGAPEQPAKVGASSSPDRTVHAVTPFGTEIVRYDRAGKWYFENATRGTREHTDLAHAVQVVVSTGAQFFPGRMGGSRFDAGVRAGRSRSRA